MSLSRTTPRVFGYGGLSQVAVICILVVVALAPFAAAAQEGVSCGLVETSEGPQFWGPCPNQSNRPQTPVFAGTWYAAIAKSASSPVWGASWHDKSQAEAESNALSRCRKNGHKDCKIAITGANNCLSLAESTADGAWGVASSSFDRSQAISLATNNCRKYGGHACEVVTTPCGRSLATTPACIQEYSNDISRGEAWARMSPEEKQMWNKHGNGTCK